MSLTDAEMSRVPPGMILRAMVDQAEQEAITEGIKAWIRQFMADYSDETHLPSDVYEVLQRWFSDYMDEDLDETIQGTLDAISSETRGGRQFSRYFTEDEDD